MSKIKPFDGTFDNEDICFVYDPYMQPKRPYWTESSFMIYAALSQLIFTRSKMESINYFVYDNLMLEMKLIDFNDSSDYENIATRFLVTL